MTRLFQSFQDTSLQEPNPPTWAYLWLDYASDADAADRDGAGFEERQQAPSSPAPGAIVAAVEGTAGIGTTSGATAVERLTRAVADAAGREVELERPKDASLGDYATNVALQTAKALGRPPRELAEELRTKLAELAAIESAKVAGPGFLNLRLADGFFVEALAEIGDDYGAGWAASAERVQVELVSANPTGPVTVASARNGAYGDSVARLLAFAGHRVEREYYWNDAGRQMDRFRASVDAARRGEARKRPATTAPTCRRSPPSPAIRCRTCSSRSSRRWSAFASASTRSSARSSSSPRSRLRSSASTRTRPRAPCGRAPARTATTRTGRSSARPTAVTSTSPPTRRTSATSSTATTARSTSSAPITTVTSRGCGRPPR